MAELLTDSGFELGDSWYDQGGGLYAPNYYELYNWDDTLDTRATSPVHGGTYSLRLKRQPGSDGYARIDLKTGDSAAIQDNDTPTVSVWIRVPSGSLGDGKVYISVWERYSVIHGYWNGTDWSALSPVFILAGTVASVDTWTQISLQVDANAAYWVSGDSIGFEVRTTAQNAGTGIQEAYFDDFSVDGVTASQDETVGTAMEVGFSTATEAGYGTQTPIEVSIATATALYSEVGAGTGVSVALTTAATLAQNLSGSGLDTPISVEVTTDAVLTPDDGPAEETTTPMSCAFATASVTVEGPATNTINTPFSVSFGVETCLE